MVSVNSDLMFNTCRPLAHILSKSVQSYIKGIWST